MLTPQKESLNNMVLLRSIPNYPVFPKLLPSSKPT